MSQPRGRKEVIDPIAAHEEFTAGGAKGRSLTEFATATPGASGPAEDTSVQTPRNQPHQGTRKSHTPKVSRGDKAGWQQQTLVLPPELRKWLKHYAVDHDAEMSDIAALALEEYRQRHKDD